MGFRKPLYDVEEKGLDPQKPHTNLGSDGRLLPAEDNLGTPTAVSSSKKEAALDETVEVKAVPEASENAAKTPQSAAKAKDKKAVDKPQDAKEELPEKPKAEKKSSTKKKVTRTRKTPAAKAAKTSSRKSTTSSKGKTTRKKTAAKKTARRTAKSKEGAT